MYSKISFQENNITVVYFRATWAIFKPQPPKNQNKIHPEKNSLYFRKWNFLALILKKFLHFLKIKLLLYFLKKKFFLYFRKRNPALFSPSSRKKNPPRENFLYFRKRKSQKISCAFSKESFSYIPGNGNPEKIPYISGNGTFLYFRK